MGLKAQLDSLDGLDQSLHQYYVKQQDGKFLLDADGVEDVSGLKSTLKKERDARTAADTALKDMQDKFKGMDPEEVKQIMSRVTNDEEGKLIAAGKIDEVINKRTEKLRQELETQVADANKRAEAEANKAKHYSQRVLDDQIREAATKAGVHVSAIEDALFRGRTMFSLDDDGKAIQLGEDQKPVLGKDGKTPFTPNEWLASMKETAPHWWPANPTGGGAGGHMNGRGGPDLSTLSPAARITAARASGRA